MKKKHNYSRKIVSPDSLALTTTLLCAVGNLSAQTTAPATGEKKADGSLPEIVVTADAEKTYKPEQVQTPKYTQPLRDIPQTINVIPQAVIQERNATSLRDVLRNVPGISMQAGEGGGGPAGDNLSIRGFAARSDIFVDGIRDTAGGGYNRDPFNIEQIEVAKGPSSTNSGRGSTGGSINLATKTPKLDTFYRGDIGGGTDSYFRSTIDINVPLWVNGGEAGPAVTGKDPVTGKETVTPGAAASGQSGAAFRLNALYHDADIPGRDEVNNQRWGVAPSVAFGLGTPTRLTLSYMHLDQDNVPDYGIPWVPRNSINPDLPGGEPPVSFDNYYGSRERDYERTKTDIVTAILEHDFSDSLKWRTALRYGRNDRDSVTTAPRFKYSPASAPPTTFPPGENAYTLNRQFQSRDQVDETYGLQSDLRADFNTGSVSHQLVVGIEAAREESINYNRSSSAGSTPLTNLFNPNPWDPFTGTISRTGAFTETSSDILGVYLFDTAKFNEQWSLTGGVRWDSFDTDYTNFDPARDSALGQRIDRNSDASEVSFRAALTYKPVEHGTFYAGYGTSFNPSTENLTYIGAPAIDGNGNPTNNTESLLNADPEETETFEIGTKWDLFDERLSLSAAVFRTEKTNARTTDPADATQVSLTGEQVVQGVELGLTGSITDKWKVFGGYTYLDSEVKKSGVAAEVGAELSNTPEHSFSLWTMHELPAGFSVGVGAQYVGERYNNSNPTTRQKADDYIVVDAMVNYQLNENVSFRLNGYNLFDERYIDRVGGGHFIPGAGRSVSLTASFNF